MTCAADRTKTKGGTSRLSDDKPEALEQPIDIVADVLDAEHTPGGKPKKPSRRTRGPRDPSKSPKLYFHSGTQAAIGAYQKCVDNKERAKIYVAEIMPAFTRLAENLINIHRFMGLHDTHEELRNDCVSFLFESIHKFDMERGSNAFSYFNVVAKNWLIIRSKQRVQKSRRTVSLDEPGALSHAEQHTLDERNFVPSQDDAIDDASAPASIIKMMREIKARVKSESEHACIDAIIQIFERADQIDLLNKSAILLYMRELSGLTPKQLTMTMQSIKRTYRKLKGDARLELF